MKATITLDSWDGSESKSKDVDLEEVRMSDLIMLMMGAGVAGVTITKHTHLNKAVSKMNQGGDNYEN